MKYLSFSGEHRLHLDDYSHPHSCCMMCLAVTRCTTPTGPRIVKEFGKFERLTSVHVNSTDDHMLVSGYTFGVSLFDISTGSVRFPCLGSMVLVICNNFLLTERKSMMRYYAQSSF